MVGLCYMSRSLIAVDFPSIAWECPVANTGASADVKVNQGERKGIFQQIQQ